MKQRVARGAASICFLAACASISIAPQPKKGAQVEEPSKTEPGEFLVFSQQTGHKSSVVAGQASRRTVRIFRLGI
jgi:hypothetical protein